MRFLLYDGDFVLGDYRDHAKFGLSLSWWLFGLFLRVNLYILTLFASDRHAHQSLGRVLK